MINKGFFLLTVMAEEHIRYAVVPSRSMLYSFGVIENDLNVKYI